MHPKVAEAQNHLSLVSPVQLDRGDQIMGTIFRKQIMSYGRWVNPNWWWEDELWMELTEEIADQMISNFNLKTFGKRISVPRNHTGNVDANAGEVVKLEKGIGGLYAYLDIRDPKTVQDIENGLIFDVSMGFDFDYVDQKEGLHHGATLIHVALVTDPYLNDMADFEKTDKVTLSKRFEDWVGSFGFGKDTKSIIMMSKTNVEELKRMKFAKVTNDKDHEVTVTYTDAEGAEQSVVVAAGAEVEVPTEAEEAVKTQIAEAVAPEADDDIQETEDEKNAREQKEADDKVAADKEIADKKAADEAAAADGEQALSKNERAELAKYRAERADFEANKAYEQLLSKGKITPAQKNLFLAAVKTGSLNLSADIKLADGKVLLAKSETASIVTLLSAILKAGPTLEMGEKGADEATEGQVALSDEDRKQLKKLGVNPETYMKQVADGKIKVNVEEK